MHPHVGSKTGGQGIPDYINAPSEQYDGIVCIIHTTLAEGQYTDPVLVY